MKRKLIIAILILCCFAAFGVKFISAEGTGYAKKISLDIKGMDILDVLKIIANQSGFNIVAGRNVTGRVTIFLKDVDVWDAFEIILASNNLAFEKKGDIINVMTERDYELKNGEKYHAKKDVKVITLRFTKAAEIAKALTQVKTPLGKIVTDEASNSVIIIDVPDKATMIEDMVYQMDSPTVTEDYTFRYAVVADIKDKFDDLLTPSIGVLKVDERMNKIIVTDSPDVVDKIIKMAQAFDDRTPQVFIECRIIEVSLTDEYKLGIDWGDVAQLIGIVFAGANLQQIYANMYTLTATPTTFSSAAKMTFHQSNITGDQVIHATVQALEKYGKVRTLSNPRLRVNNNYEAKVVVGVKDAYIDSTTTQQGDNTVTSFAAHPFEYGTTLTLTPTINLNGEVTLVIHLEISSYTDVDREAGGTAGAPEVVYPIINTTESDTTITLKDGQTAIMAGYIRDHVVDDETRIPFISAIPFVGKMFTGHRKYIIKSEMAIFITPYIIKPEEELSQDEEAAEVEDFTPQQYYQYISQKIADNVKSIANTNAKGHLQVVFILSDDGTLMGEPKIIGDKWTHIEDLAVAAVKLASPFPPFPKGMSQPKAKFNVVVSFE